MKTTTLLIISLAIVLSTALVAAANSQKELDPLQKVDATNGIDQAEAYIIAEDYFIYHISGCGYPAEPESENENWVSKTQIGIVGKPGPPILINKETGAIFWHDPKNSISLEELKRLKADQTLKLAE